MLIQIFVVVFECNMGNKSTADSGNNCWLFSDRYKWLVTDVKHRFKTFVDGTNNYLLFYRNPCQFQQYICKLFMYHNVAWICIYQSHKMFCNVRYCKITVSCHISYETYHKKRLIAFFVYMYYIGGNCFFLLFLWFFS